MFKDLVSMRHTRQHPVDRISGWFVLFQAILFLALAIG